MRRAMEKPDRPKRDMHSALKGKFRHLPGTSAETEHEGEPAPQKSQPDDLPRAGERESAFKMSEYGGSRGTSLEAENLETDRGTHGLPEGKYEEKDKGDMEEKKRVLALALFKRRR